MPQIGARLPVLVVSAAEADALRAVAQTSACVRPGVWEVEDPLLGGLLLVEEQRFPPHELTTERLFLRPLRETDGPALFAGHARHAEAMEYLTVPRHAQADETCSYARRQQQAWEEGQPALAWAVCGGQTGPVVGCFDLVRRADACLVGFAIFVEHWGRGYATEALRALLGAALADPSVRRVEAVHHPHNHASRRVLEKAGMRPVGREPAAVFYPNRSGDPGDLFRWAWTPPNGVDGPP